MPSLVVKFSEKFSKSLLNDQLIFNGKSPFVTEHNADTDSSRFNSSSPKLNGTIDGKTKEIL